ncbi:MAG TPA: DUF3604 domain-containing protein, partial [Chloroflexota bacterium]|nr:DUF3604 domain-containing protein [Chloroflexota bacterium]
MAHDRAELLLPGPVTAGSWGSWLVAVHLGALLREGDAVSIHHRWPCDWVRPQLSDPAGPHFASAKAPGAVLTMVVDESVEWHPWDHRLLVRVVAGAVQAGESVVITFGDQSAGSPGTRAQTFIEERCEFHVRVCRDGIFNELSEQPWLQVIGGPIARLVVVAPSDVTADQPFTISVRAEDDWGNPAQGYFGRIKLAFSSQAGDEHETNLAFSSPGRAVAQTAVTLDRPGEYWFQASDVEGDLRATSNPAVCHPVAPATARFWGDLHGQSTIGCGARTIRDYFLHARDFARMDFASHQGNDFMVSNAEWEETQHVTRELHDPGHFVTFLGYEWSGDPGVGGDRNMFFLADEHPIRRSSHKLVDDKSDVDTDLSPVDAVFKGFRGTETLMQPHVGGRTADLTFHAPELEPIIEIHSDHATSEWFFEEALRRGYKVGLTGGSDGVMGRPGASYPGGVFVRNVQGGLVSVLAPKLERRAIWDALFAHRCYATSGERILLDVSVDGHPMGSEYEGTGDPTIEVAVLGTAGIERLELYRSLDLIHVSEPDEYSHRPAERVRVTWSGAREPGNARRARLSWDGDLTLDRGRIRRSEGWGFQTPA